MNYFKKALPFFFCLFLSYISFGGKNFSITNIENFFTPNKGQVIDNSVLYYIRSFNNNVFFKKSSIIHQFIKSDRQNEETLTTIQNIKVDFLNSNPNLKIKEIEPLLSKVNIINGRNSRNWYKGISTFNSLLYENIYNGIDIMYYSENDRFKYDFVIHPNGNIDNIEMKYDGASNLHVNSDNQLIIETGLGKLIEQIPIAYQTINGEKELVNVYYYLYNDHVKFKIKNYNKNFDLVIDPTLLFSSLIGGSGDDYIFTGGIGVDNNHNIYATGYSSSINFPTTAGTFSTALSGDYDCIALKLKNDGSSLIYSTYFGGSGFDKGDGIYLDKTANEIYICGYTQSSNFPVTPGSFQTTFNGGPGDAFVVKLNSTGNALIYSTLVGGTGDDFFAGIDVDANGNAYTVGQNGGGNFPLTAGAYQTSNTGGWETIVAKLNPTGNSLTFSTYIGGTLFDRGTTISVDNNLNVYITSCTEGGNFPITSGAYDQSYNGGVWDIAVSKFDPAGKTLLYSTYLGGTGQDFCRTSGTKVNASTGDLYLTGFATSGFPTTTGAYDQSFNGGASDAFVSKLSSDGSTLLHSTFLGSPGDDAGYGLFLNSLGEVFVTGFCDNGFPTTPCTYDSSFNGGASDIFISKIDIGGTNLLYSSYVGGNGYERGAGIVAISDTTYCVGFTASANFPVTTGAYDTSFNGGANDIFALSLAINSGTTTAAFSSSTNTCVGQQTTFANNSSGGTAYTWNFGNGSSSNSVNPTHTYSSAGTYTVTLIVSGGCNVDSIKKTVTISPPPSANITGNTTICQGLSTTLTVSGGKTYSWSNGSTDSVLVVSPGSTTTYTVTTNIGSCASAAKTITVNVTPSPTATITGNTNICQGQSATLTVSGGKTYSWSNGSTDSVLVVSPGSSTTYTVTTNNGSCTSATKTISVNVTATPIANITGNTTICQGQSTTLTAGGGGTYQWSGGISSTSASVTVSPSSSTTYSVVVNSGGCFSLPATVSVNVLMPPAAAITGNTTVCQGQATTLTAGGGTSYQWSGGITSTSASIIVSPSSSTTYFLTASNGSCSSPPTSVTVSVNPLPIAGISGNTTICQGQSTTLTAGGGISYQWSGGISSVSSSITVSPSTSTTYYVTTNDGTCTSSPASVTVIVTPIPTAGISGITTICSGQSTTLTASGGGNYQWYGGISSTSSAVTVSPSAITTYSVVVNDGNCFSQPFSVTVQVLPVPNTTVAGDTTLCPGESTTLTANGGSTYNWSSTISVASSITVSPASTVTYTVIAGNGTCYGTSAIITVHVMPIPAASASPATSLIDHGASVNIVASGGSTYTWTPAIGLSCTNCSNPTATPDTSTIYTVTITDANGCTATAMVSILVKAFCSGNEKDIFIANIFSPNNDGKNDVLKAQGNGLRDIYWAIFDRWGNKVFETTDLSKTWDGTYRGEMVVAGTYFYILKATCIQSNSEIDLKGNVTVIR